jgi:hypothetical protein
MESSIEPYYNSQRVYSGKHRETSDFEANTTSVLPMKVLNLADKTSLSSVAPSTV